MGREVSTHRRTWRPALAGALLGLLAGGCADVVVVEHHLSEHVTAVALESAPDSSRRIYSASDEQVTLTAFLDAGSGSGARRFLVEWLLPDGRVYIRRPVRPERPGGEAVVTSMAIRGEPPSRRPGLWRVRLILEGEMLVESEFEIRDGGVESSFTTASSLGGCRSRRGPIPRSAWVGAEALRRMGESYEPAVLLSSPRSECPPIRFQGRPGPGS